MKENERKRENTYDTRGPLFNRAHASAAFFQSIGSPGVDIGGVGLCDGVDLWCPLIPEGGGGWIKGPCWWLGVCCPYLGVGWPWWCGVWCGVWYGVMKGVCPEGVYGVLG